jgi:hypothetical protein
MRSVYARVILHKQLRLTIVRQETFAQRFNVALGAVSTLCSIKVPLYNN